MRIALVSPRYSPCAGGIETLVARLASSMAAHGHDVDVLTQTGDRALPLVELAGGATVRRFPVALPSQNYAFAPGLWRYLGRQGDRYDVVHAHNYHALPALGAALAGCKPLVFSPHYHGAGHAALRQLLHWPYRSLGATIFRRSSRIMCVSHAEAALVRRHFPASGRRIIVIPNGVDTAALRATTPLPRDRTVVLCAGRLERYKNVHLVLASLRHLDDSFALRIVGDGPARQALERHVTRLGLQGRVAFLGRVDDAELYRWLRTASTFVSMSEHEAFGIALLEALAAGTRVVAADIPAYREIASHAAPGAVSLLPLRTAPETLAGMIRHVSAQTTGPLPLIVSVASWDAVAARTLEVYETLARRAARHRGGAVRPGRHLDHLTGS